MPKRKESTQCAGRGNKRRATSKAAAEPEAVSCPVCLEDFAPDGTDAFPCTHKTCKLCFLRCENCPLCRMGKNGMSDQERREAQVQFQLPIPISGARLLITPMSREEVQSMFSNSAQLGTAGTPFDTNSFQVRTQGLSAGMNGVIGEIVHNVLAQQRRTGRATTRGELQQTTSDALLRSTAPASASRRSANGTRRAGFEGVSPATFTIRDILGFVIEADSAEAAAAAAERRRSSSSSSS